MPKQFSLKLSAAVLLVVLLAGGGFGLGYVARDWHVSPVKSAAEPDFKSLSEVYRTLQNKFDGTLDPAKLLDGAKAGLAAATGDPYTAYLNSEATKALNDDLSGTVSGIGAEVGIRSSKLIIIAPIADSPAAKAGLKPKDEIVKIDEIDPGGLGLDEAVGKIRGKAGTEVKLMIVRSNGMPFEVAITRAVITVASVKWSLKPNGVGYIQLTRFGSDTASKMRQAATELREQGAQKIVLDMRNNPGGYLESAVEVAGQFLDRKLVVEERRGSKSVDKMTSSGGGELVGLKTVVLINGGSASASEIVAGALQDHKVATVVGEKSFGKGSVQEVARLNGGANLKVTVAHWYTPNGKNINKEGIKPDVEVKSDPNVDLKDKDPQLDKALELLRI